MPVGSADGRVEGHQSDCEAVEGQVRLEQRKEHAVTAPTQVALEVVVRGLDCLEVGSREDVAEVPADLLVVQLDELA